MIEDTITGGRTKHWDGIHLHPYIIIGGISTRIQNHDERMDTN
ncbi:MAG: hypothetical protein ACYDAJ_12080 [Nitrosotalea sp.]